LVKGRTVDAETDLDTLHRVMGHANFMVLQCYLDRTPASVQAAHHARAPVDRFL
jgi:hypothetical protein